MLPAQPTPYAPCVARRPHRVSPRPTACSAAKSTKPKALRIVRRLLTPLVGFDVGGNNCRTERGFALIGFVLYRSPLASRNTVGGFQGVGDQVAVGHNVGCRQTRFRHSSLSGAGISDLARQ